MLRLGAKAAGVALAAAALAGTALGQQGRPILPPPKPAPGLPHVKVYSPGGDVAAPELASVGLRPVPNEQCREKQNGKVEFSFLVDTDGMPRNIMFVKPVGWDLDLLAIRILESDRFKPGTLAGKPVVVAETVAFNLETCTGVARDNTGVWTLYMRAVPRQKLGKLKLAPQEAVLTSAPFKLEKPAHRAARPEYLGADTSPPVLIFAVNPDYDPASEHAGLPGSCLVSLTVDPQGVPHNVQVVKGLSPSMNREALEAAQRSRYFPAIRDGEPVTAVVTQQVSFAPPEDPLN